MAVEAQSNRLRVAVLGATGCVGRCASTAFSRKGYDILAIARNYAKHIAKYEFASLDIAAADPDHLAEVFEHANVEVLVNATGGWDTTEDKMAYSHIQLTNRLLAAAAMMPRRLRIVQVGSIHEYGPVSVGTSIAESIKPSPTTPYARTKLSSSQAVLASTREGAVDGVVLRPVNVCGPFTTPASFLGAVVHRLREAATEKVVLNVADARRDYIDVRDLAEAIVLAAEAPVVGRVINIGRGVAIDMRELVWLIVAAAGFPSDLITLQNQQVQSKGGGWTQADIRLAARLLGWSPKISLPDSMRAMWEATGQLTSQNQ